MVKISDMSYNDKAVVQNYHSGIRKLHKRQFVLCFN